MQGVKLWIGAVLAAALAAAPAQAFEFEGFPGSTWGQASYDNDDISGSGVMGFINQGVLWGRLPGGVAVVTYAEYRHRSRNKNQIYYDAGGPAVGLELRKSVFIAGVDYYWETLPVLGEKSERAQGYAGWFVDWDIASLLGLTRAPRLPGSSWAQVSYDNDDISGSGVMGFINQGVDILQLPGGVTVNAYGEYRHRSRDKNQEYYDAGGPAVGMELQRSPVRAGVDYYWERLPVLGESSERAQLYVSWYLDWDLKRKE